MNSPSATRDLSTPDKSIDRKGIRAQHGKRVRHTVDDLESFLTWSDRILEKPTTTPFARASRAAKRNESAPKLSQKSRSKLAANSSKTKTKTTTTTSKAQPSSGPIPLKPGLDVASAKKSAKQSTKPAPTLTATPERSVEPSPIPTKPGLNTVAATPSPKQPAPAKAAKPSIAPKAPAPAVGDKAKTRSTQTQRTRKESTQKETVSPYTAEPVASATPAADKPEFDAPKIQLSPSADTAKTKNVGTPSLDFSNQPMPNLPDYTEYPILYMEQRETTSLRRVIKSVGVALTVGVVLAVAALGYAWYTTGVIVKEPAVATLTMILVAIPPVLTGVFGFASLRNQARSRVR